MTALTPKYPAQFMVSRLAQDGEPGLINPWAGDDHAAQARRDALCRHLNQMLPQFVLLSSQCTAHDALLTGIPLVSPSAIEANLVSYFIPPSDPNAVITPDYSCAIWRALNLHGMGRYSIAFSLVPFVSPTGAALPRDKVLHHARWAEQFIRYYSGIKVIAFGNAVSSVLTSRGIGHGLLEPPNRVGVNLFEQIKSLREAGLRGWDETEDVLSSAA